MIIITKSITVEKIEIRELVRKTKTRIVCQLMYFSCNGEILDLPPAQSLVLNFFYPIEVITAGVTGPAYPLTEHTPGMFSLGFLHRLNIPWVCSACKEVKCH